MAACLFVLVNSLASRPSGLSELEVETINKVDSLGSIIDEPLNPLVKLAQLASLSFFGPTELGLRVGVVAAAIAAGVIFFLMLKEFYWTRKALIGTLMLCTTSWFLHHARLGQDSIGLVVTASLFLLAVYKTHQTRSLPWLAALAFTLALSLYTPLMIYVVLVTAGLFYNDISAALRQLSQRKLIMSSVFFVILCLPLLFAAIRDVSILQAIFNIPDGLPSPADFFLNLSDTLSHIFWQSMEQPQFHLQTLPMLDIFTVVMVALGLYKFERDWPSKRSKLVFGSLVMLLLALSLNFSYQYVIILAPFVFILASTGVNTLLRQWQSVFPNNPVARTIGLLPVILVLLLTLNYNYNRYHVAWANSPETQLAFDEAIPRLQEEISERSQDSNILVITDQSAVQSFRYFQQRFDFVTVVQVDSLSQTLLNNATEIVLVDRPISVSLIEDSIGTDYTSFASSDPDASELFRIYNR